MSIVAIVQARMGSTRLPGKVLMDLEGESVLARVVQRLRRSLRLQHIVVATTDLPMDDAILQECERLKCPVFRGSSEDVLDRYYRAARSFHCETVVRITSDCPLIDATVVDETIRRFCEQGADYASNGIEQSFPRGLDVEVFTAQALSLAWKESSQPYEREHVTPYFYGHSRVFRLASVRAPDDFSKHRWTLDTPEDMRLIREIYARFRPRTDFGWKEVLCLLKNIPEIASVNAAISQKELHPS